MGINFLYYMVEQGYWLVGDDLWIDQGGLFNTGDQQCAEGKRKRDKSKMSSLLVAAIAS